jgi:hypothetical protein
LIVVLAGGRFAAMFCIFATGALYFSQQPADQSAVKKCPGALR